MARRSVTRHLLFFGMAVALVAHLWMLHGPMPAANDDVGLSEAAPAVGGAVQPASQPSGDQHRPDTPFMALTCMAVLVGVAAVWLGARTWGNRAASLPDGPADPRTPRPRGPLRWQPSLPPASRVDAGVLLLV